MENYAVGAIVGICLVCFFGAIAIKMQLNQKKTGEGIRSYDDISPWSRKRNDEALTPGSEGAIKNGCTCDPQENNFGEGVRCENLDMYTMQVHYVAVSSCPLHKKQTEEDLETQLQKISLSYKQQLDLAKALKESGV